MVARPSNFVDNMTVSIKPLAYYKMLVHVLRFGNKVRNRRQYREVMGMLIGRLEGKPNKDGIDNVIIEDAVPVSHGGSIEVAFTPDDYGTFSYIDMEYAERDPPLFTVGWYHSHPSLKIFYSATDIKNQLYWQNVNPSAVGIVFDHTYLETPEDLGFRTFRLDNPEKGPLTEYHEVKTVVEPPDNIEYYIKIIELVNSIHSKEPPILELNETPDLFGDIIIPGQSQIMTKQPELELTDMLESLQSGIVQFLELSFEPLIRFLNEWSQEIIKGVVEQNMQMRNDLISLKENMSTGISKVQSTFKNSLTNKLYDLDAYIDDRFEGFDKDRESITNIITLMKEEINTQISKYFEEKVKASINQVLTLIDEKSNSINEINEKSSKNLENLETQQTSLEPLSQKIKSIGESTLDKLKATQEKNKGEFTEKEKAIMEKINPIINSFTELNKQTREFLTDLDTSFSILESSKKTLEGKLKKSEGGA